MAENDKLYYRSDLENYLKSINVPASHPTILKYEKLGIISSPRLNVPRKSGEPVRVYTWAEIVAIGEKIKKLKQKGKKNG